MSEIRLGDRLIGPDREPYVVAEAGINHDGDIAAALEMVRVAKGAGADAIKFQTFRAEEFIGDPALTYTYRSQGRDVTESMLEMFRRCELPRGAWSSIKAECDRREITFLSTPSSKDDLDLLLAVGVPAIKVGSDELTNLPLVREFAATGLPLMISCGMADLSEVRAGLAAAGALDGRPTVLMLCTSLYPTPPADVHLRRLATLHATFPDVILGLSDHTQGVVASVAAAALGAVVFEKHFTLGHDRPGPDHWFSADPYELADWVRAIRATHQMLGTPVVQPTQDEAAMRAVARRSVVALRSIAEGEVLTRENVGLRRPGTGLPPASFDWVLGRTAVRHLHRGEAVSSGDVST